MKNFKKFLQASNRLEERQTARKAKEVDEVQKFDLQLESHKQIKMLESIDAEQVVAKSRKHTLDEIVAYEQQRIELATDELLETEDFETEAFEVAVNTEIFQDISEIQKPENLNQPKQIKQLPAGPPDPFDHELSDLTEECLRRETEKNDAAIKQMQEEDEESARQKGPLFFNPRSI